MAMPEACGKLVLVVDDDHDIRDAVEDALSAHHYRSASASNGREGLAWLRAADEKPCLILLDLMMPVMDGWQFRAAQKADDALNEIPVVVITAHATGSANGVQVDAARILRKPFTLEHLLNVVDELCSDA